MIPCPECGTQIPLQSKAGEPSRLVAFHNCGGERKMRQVYETDANKTFPPSQEVLQVSPPADRECNMSIDNSQDKKLLGLFNKQPLAMFGLLVLALIAITASGMRTFDLAYNISPPEVAILVAVLTVLVLDGGFLSLDLIFPYVKTQGARAVIGLFMGLLWITMAGTNITDAFYNMRLATAKGLSWGTIFLYGLAVIGLIYLLVYVYIRFNDPDTKRILMAAEVQEVRDNELMKEEIRISRIAAERAATGMAIRNISAKFKAEHGVSIESVLGANWADEIIAKTTGAKVPEPAKSEPVIPTVPEKIAGMIDDALLKITGKKNGGDMRPDPTEPPSRLSN